MQDDLSPVLEKILDCDALLLGSPIYFSNITGENAQHDGTNDVFPFCPMTATEKCI
jgi:hypothetical protein